MAVVEATLRVCVDLVGNALSKNAEEGVMKCANPVCNRGIGLVAYQRGWFGKRRYCTKHCRDAFVADAPKPQRELNRSLVRRFVVASAGFAALVIPAAFTMAVLAAPSVRPAAPSMPGCDRDLAIASASVAAMHARVNSLAGIGRSETCKATQFLFLEVVKEIGRASCRERV